jgi:hypothetical protein
MSSSNMLSVTFKNELELPVMVEFYERRRPGLMVSESTRINAGETRLLECELGEWKVHSVFYNADKDVRDLWDSFWNKKSIEIFEKKKLSLEEKIISETDEAEKSILELRLNELTLYNYYHQYLGKFRDSPAVDGLYGWSELDGIFEFIRSDEDKTISLRYV